MYIIHGISKIFGDQNKILTAVILKFPITLADSLIPYLLYKIAIIFDKERHGLISSIIYALNPISLIEISVGTFHSIGSLFFLLSIYYLLIEKYKFTGFFTALGFFTSEFPLIGLGLSSIFLRKELINLLQLIVSFLISSIIIVILVLIPYNAKLDDMYLNLSRHPIYKGTIRGVISESYSFMNENFGVPKDTYYDIWLILFLSLMLIPIILLGLKSSKILILDALIFQITLLSLFFTANHTKHIFWLFPWLTLWAVSENRKIRFAPILLTLIYFLRRYSQDFLENAVWITTLMLAMLGGWILTIAFSNMIDFSGNNCTRSATSNECHHS